MSSRYIPALDGLRALAVIAVVILPHERHRAAKRPARRDHLLRFVGLPHHRSAHQGMVHRQKDQPSPILAQARSRLFPAIVFVLAGTIVLTAAFAPDMLTKLRNDLPAALLFFTNWWYIFQDVSYFEAMGRPLRDPLLVACHRGAVLPHLASASPPAVLEAREEAPYPAGTSDPPPSRPPRRWRCSTHPKPIPAACTTAPTRARSHCSSARFWRLSSLPRASTARATRLHRTRPQDRADHRGRGACGHPRHDGRRQRLFPVFVLRRHLAALLLTGALIITLADGRSPLARFFALRPLVWIGKFSYSIYLWHYPLLLLMNPRNFTGETLWFAYVGQALVILAVSAVSYYLVETPLRRGAIGKAVKGIREKQFTIREYALTTPCSSASGRR